MSHQDLLEELNRTAIQFLIKEPFFGAFLSGISQTFSNAYPRIAIAKIGNTGFRLSVNPHYWQKNLTVKGDPQKTDELRYNAIKGQLLNIMFKVFLFPDTSQTPKIQTSPFVSKTIESPAPVENPSWEAFKLLNGAEKKMIINQINHLIICAKQKAGPKHLTGLPGNLINLFAALEQPIYGKLHWKRLLNLFVAGSRKTRLKNTIRKPSKRYGTSPGIRIKNNNRLLVALDTSGSVSNAEIKRFFGEIHLIWKRGAEILIQEVDHIIRRQYFYAGHLPEKVEGRGATDFNAPILYANNSWHPDGLIYFTDGLASAPKEKSRSPILWIITKNGIKRGGKQWDLLPFHKIKLGQ